jgi:hypothetical protein
MEGKCFLIPTQAANFAPEAFLKQEQIHVVLQVGLTSIVHTTTEQIVK